MWTEITRPKYERAGRRYASDLTDAEWRLIEPYMPAVKRLGRPRETNLRAIVDAILYIARTGCQWRLLPKDFPPYQTVYDYFRSWRFLGAWGPDTRQTARRCAGSTWPQSGAERWNYQPRDFRSCSGAGSSSAPSVGSTARAD